VGRLAADALGAHVVDIDASIERRENRTVAELFAARGERWFRGAEKRETEGALTAAPGVIVPGGGWAAQPGTLAAAAERGMTVYLKTAPETAAQRVTAETRPLLAGADLEARMRQLLAQREAFYQQCEARVSTDQKTAEKVAGMVVELARCWGGW
jgi:shikimate kinase